jgi:hypothetical protein
MPDTKPSIEMFEDVIRSTYRANVRPEEYENKCASNPDAVRKIAYYFRETGYSFTGSPLVEAEWEHFVSGQIVFLLDFLNFTEGI